MIGNDIVDLCEASKSPHWSDERFINKVFSADEKDLILRSSNRFRLTWLLWSMKESAYKVHLRKYRNPFFAPSRIECDLDQEGSGRIRIEESTYTSSTIFYEDFIYTVVLSDPLSEYTGGYHKAVDSSYANLHNKCYRDVIKMGSAKLLEQVNTMVIKKDKHGIPKLYAKNIEQPLIFSITHHGRYYAYAILK